MGGTLVSTSDRSQVRTAPLARAPADNLTKCMARTWGNGHGSQCKRSRKDGIPFCMVHAKEAERGGGVPAHGRIDGPIPETKHLRHVDLVLVCLPCLRRKH